MTWCSGAASRGYRVFSSKYVCVTLVAAGLLIPTGGGVGAQVIDWGNSTSAVGDPSNNGVAVTRDLAIAPNADIGNSGRNSEAAEALRHPVPRSQWSFGSIDWSNSASARGGHGTMPGRPAVGSDVAASARR